MSLISTNLKQINQSLSSPTKLIAVSKTKSEQMIREAYALGQRDFGENKVQELLEKSLHLGDLEEIRWHFIGTLQSNKVNQLLKVENLVSIHSVDSFSLLNKILRKESRRKIGIFLQVNTSKETEKSGFVSQQDIIESVQHLEDSHSFYFQGLMTIGKIRTEQFERDAKECFLSLKEISLKLEPFTSRTVELSMGMSQDYLIAQECGSHWVRIGSQLFGSR